MTTNLMTGLLQEERFRVGGISSLVTVFRVRGFSILQSLVECCSSAGRRTVGGIRN